MKCSRVRRMLIRFEDGNVPRDVQEHLDTCPACREYAEHNTAVRKLVGLKRYEQPDEKFEERCLYAIRRRLAEKESTFPAVVHGSWSSLSPVLHYCLAATFLALLGFHVLVPAFRPGMQPRQLTAEQVEAVEIVSAAAPAMTNPVMAEMKPPFRRGWPSNTAPDRIQYGTIPSRAVDFQY